jgi:hypothetical protein
LISKPKTSSKIFIFQTIAFAVFLDERNSAVFLRLKRRSKDVSARIKSGSERRSGHGREVEPVRLHPGLDAHGHRSLRLRAQEQQTPLVLENPF